MLVARGGFSSPVLLLLPKDDVAPRSSLGARPTPAASGAKTRWQEQAAGSGLRPTVLPNPRLSAQLCSSALEGAAPVARRWRALDAPIFKFGARGTTARPQTGAAVPRCYAYPRYSAH